MPAKPLAILVLAAGKGTRMKSRTAKVLHPLLGKPMLDHVLDLAASVPARRRGVVVGHQADTVASVVPSRTFEIIHQKKQLGTGHAVRQADGLLRGRGDLLVLSGDTPLLTKKTLNGLLGAHRRSKGAVTLLTTTVANPKGYGRIIRGAGGEVTAIVEETDGTAAERAVREINTGIYCFDRPFLAAALAGLRSDNRQGEYYLTDVIAAACRQGRSVRARRTEDAGEIMGINSRGELAVAEGILRRRKLEGLMAAGVTVVDPATTWVEGDVRIGADTVLLPMTVLEGETRIGRDCRIGPGARIRHSRLGRGVTVKDSCVIESAKIADGCTVGPFAHLRPGAELGKGAKVGNFVEVKKSRIGAGSKASHLTYIGDAEVGRNVNIGAGTITCNYDGVKKWLTVIEDGVFIGSNSALVAPVRIGRGALVGAGTTVTADVPPGDIALSRAPQENRKGLAAAYLKGGKKKNRKRK